MKKLILLLTMACFLTSCNITETVVFTEDGSGEFLVSYDMGEAMKKMKENFGGESEDEEKEAGEIMDTTMVFADLMEMEKDSIAALPEENRLALEAIKDMYMKMYMDEDKEIMNFGVGMKFTSINDLKDIQEKIKKVQNLNGQNAQISAMKSGSPLGKFMGNDDNKVDYNYTDKGFSRVTTIIQEDESLDFESLFDDTDETDKEFMGYFTSSSYNVKLVFPKKIKSTSVNDATISEDGKTLTYKVNWIEFLKDPKLLDVEVEFYE